MTWDVKQSSETTLETKKGAEQKCQRDVLAKVTSAVYVWFITLTLCTKVFTLLRTQTLLPLTHRRPNLTHCIFFAILSVLLVKFLKFNQQASHSLTHLSGKTWCFKLVTVDTQTLRFRDRVDYSTLHQSLPINVNVNHTLFNNSTTLNTHCIILEVDLTVMTDRLPHTSPSAWPWHRRSEGTRNMCKTASQNKFWHRDSSTMISNWFKWKKMPRHSWLILAVT